MPVSESMPTTPPASTEGNTVRLPQFINAIKKRWDMSLKEAMDLLHVTTLEGANLRESYNQLQTIMESQKGNAPRPNAPVRMTQSPPAVEAPRSGNRPGSAPSSSVNSVASGARTQGQAALREAAKPAPSTAPILENDLANEPRHRTEAGNEFAGSPKAPIPIQLGAVVRNAVPHTYKFEEEDDEDEEYEPPPDAESDEADTNRLRAQLKLDELREIRASTAASPERLTVLNNLVDSQISEEQLLKIVQGVWGVTAKKKLKAQQVEELISWAKEDYFVEEVEVMLMLIEEGEE
jgi:hypothetical protein